MSRPLVIIGGGGMGRCVLDVVDAVNASLGPRSGELIEVVGMVDDGRPDEELLGARGVKLLGTTAVVDTLSADVGFLVGIANPGVRRGLVDKLAASDRRSPTLVHPNVHLGYDVSLSPGTIICSHVSVENHVRFGRHVHVNQNSTIGHDSVLSDFATVSPLVAVSGNVTIGSDVFVGTGASIRQGVVIGSASTIGMGAAVVTDVPPSVTMLGVPARPAT